MPYSFEESFSNMPPTTSQPPSSLRYERRHIDDSRSYYPPLGYPPVVIQQQPIAANYPPRPITYNRYVSMDESMSDLYNGIPLFVFCIIMIWLSMKK